MTVDSLVAAAAKTSFAIVYDEIKGAPGGGPGVFVWRQHAGKRRRDELPVHGATQGSFLIEGDFIQGASGFPSRGRGCSWGAPSGRTPHIECGDSTGDVGLRGTIEFAFLSKPVTEIGSRTIAGIEAKCYAFELRFVDFRGDAIMCLSDLGLPLFFDGLDAGRVRHQITAVSVSLQADLAESPVNDLGAPYSTQGSESPALWDLPAALRDASGVH